MSTHPAAQSLLWVKAELEKNLDRAEKAWHGYVEGDRGEAALAETLALMREVRGVLQTIELDGGALLAHEVERTLAAIESGRREAQGETLAVLTRAILQLPLYLERVVGTMHDNPHVLLPLLNDLRAEAGEPALDEPGLKTALHMLRRAHAGRASHSDFATLARTLRPRYQSHLLGVYERSVDASALAAMMEICAQIEGAVTETASFELWWAASAFLEALRDAGLPLSTERKQLLGRLDGVLKRLAGGGGAAGPDEHRLRDTLLAQVREATSAGPRVRAVQETYRDRDRDEGWSASTADLSSPSYAALRTVGGAVHDDLRFVKTQLDIYQRQKPEERRAEDLAPLVSVLRKSASTLSVLGLTALHDDLKAQAEALEQATRTALPNDALFEVAATLLKVEDGLDEEIERLTHARALREAGVAEPDVLLSQARAAAIREVLVNLARVRNELSASSAQSGTLPASLSAHLNASVSVLRLLDYGKAAALIERLRRIVEPGLWRQIAALPQGAQLFARLADAFVSVEYWLETVRQQRPGAENLLENAEACLLPLEAAYAKIRHEAESARPSEEGVAPPASPAESAVPASPAASASPAESASPAPSAPLAASPPTAVEDTPAPRPARAWAGAGPRCARTSPPGRGRRAARCRVHR